MRTTFREPDVVPGVLASIQTFGSLVNWHPHLHLLVTDGAFRPDGTFLHLGFHDIEILTEAFRRAVLREFVRHELLTDDDAQSMLAWEHSGFHATSRTAPLSAFIGSPPGGATPWNLLSLVTLNRAEPFRTVE